MRRQAMDRRPLRSLKESGEQSLQQAACLRFGELQRRQPSGCGVLPGVDVHVLARVGIRGQALPGRLRTDGGGTWVWLGMAAAAMCFHDSLPRLPVLGHTIASVQSAGKH